VIPLFMACAAPVDLGAPQWPTEGCTSVHRPVWGHTLTRGEEVWFRTEDGESIAGAVVAPVIDGCWPALLLVPPGFEGGLDAADELTTQQIAGAGVVVLAYDPRGRGDSTGDEDHVGARQQDDLAAVLSWLAARGEVDPTRVHVRTRSLGIAQAAGAVHRHPVLAPAGLFDLEGPGILPDDLAYANDHANETWDGVAGDEDWWLERSPREHLGAFAGDYLRVQAQEDHALGGFKGHAKALLNTAEDGAARSVRLNGVALSAISDEGQWHDDDVEDLSLEGRVKHDDPRALALLLEMLR